MTSGQSEASVARIDQSEASDGHSTQEMGPTGHWWGLPGLGTITRRWVGPGGRHVLTCNNVQPSTSGCRGVNMIHQMIRSCVIVKPHDVNSLGLLKKF